MKISQISPCDILFHPRDEKYAENIRQFQGCPTLAVTKNGRIFLGWYSGGTREPHIENYNLLIYSDDGGKTWTDPVLIIPSSKEKMIHALDIQLWIDPDGKLHVFWVQNMVKPIPAERPVYPYMQPAYVDGYMFDDFDHAEWEMVCDDPDAKDLHFSEPRYLYEGFLRCKPTVLASGRWLCFAYNQMHDRYAYYISDDKGATYTRNYGTKKIATNFDEGMAYQKNDGTVRMFARSGVKQIVETMSHDEGLTWTDAVQSGIDSPDTRFYVARTPTSRILLINNDAKDSRSNMTVYLSEDDGETWKYKRCIDPRDALSYPDADFHGGRIYLTYDRGRTTDKEILFMSFTEEDIMNPDYTFEPTIVSKPRP